MVDILIKKAIKGDKEALLKLIMNDKDSYYRLALSYMRNTDDALDMLQEMIVVLYKEINSLKKPSSFYSWSKTILVNLCKKELIKRSKEFKMQTTTEVIDIDNLNNSTDKIYLDSLIQNLNEDQKEAITMRYYLDYSYDDISTML